MGQLTDYLDNIVGAPAGGQPGSLVSRFDEIVAGGSGPTLRDAPQEVQDLLLQGMGVSDAPEQVQDLVLGFLQDYAEPSIDEDIANIPHAMARGVTQIPGFLGDAMDFGMWLARGVEDATGIPAGSGLPGHEELPRSSDMAALFDETVGPVPEANTPMGSALLEGSEWAGGAVSPFPLQTMLPAFAGGVVSDVTGSTAAGIGASLAGLPFALRRPMSSVLGGATRGINPEQYDMGMALMGDAYRQETPLLVSEALDSEQLRNLTSAIRESDTQGSAILDQFLAQRPQQNRDAFNQSMDNLAAPAPGDVGPVVADARNVADRTIIRARQERNQQFEPIIGQFDDATVSNDAFNDLLQGLDREIQSASAGLSTGVLDRLRQLRNEVSATGGNVRQLFNVWRTGGDNISGINIALAPLEDRQTATIMRRLLSPIRETLGTDVQGFDAAMAEYRRLSEELVEPLTGPYGTNIEAITQEMTGATTPTQAVGAIANAEMRRPAGIEDAIERMMEATQAGELPAEQGIAGVMRAFFENVFDRSSRPPASQAYQQVGRETGGAVFASRITGQLRENVLAALREIDPSFADEFGSLLDTWSRQAAIPGSGSQTGFRNWINQVAQDGGVLGQAVGLINVFDRGGVLGRIQTGMGLQGRERMFTRIAEILTDPNGIRLLQQAARYGSDDPRRWSLVSQAVMIGRESEQ